MDLVQSGEILGLVGLELELRVFVQQLGNNREDPDDADDEQRNVHIVEKEAAHARPLETPVNGGHIEQPPLCLGQVVHFGPQDVVGDRAALLPGRHVIEG